MADDPKQPAPAPAKPASNMLQRVILWVIGFAVAYAIYYVADTYIINLT